MLGIDGIPENLYFLPLGGFPTVLDELGWSLLEREIDAHGFKFVIVDTWQRVKTSKTGKGSNLTLYEEDYELPGKLQAFATQKGIAILVVHQGKDEDNPFHDISGLTGMQAAPNALITLRRKNGGIVCSVAGRDFESRELAMSFDKGHWQIEGDADMAFGVEKPERGRYSPVLNSDSVKDLLKKLIKGAWYLIKWWYLMPFISGLLGELPLGL